MSNETRAVTWRHGIGSAIRKPPLAVTPPAHPHGRHEAVFHATDGDLLDVLAPFVRGGSDAGEPTLVALGERRAALVRSALPAGTAVEFLPADTLDASPATVIRVFREIFARHVAAGARQIRLAGELPPLAFGATWHSWARYEAAVNHAYDEFPLWSLCAYDLRSTPDPVLRDVLRTHPGIAGPSGAHVPNERYTDPATFLSEQRVMAPDPVQESRPCAVLTDPSPGEARRAVRDADPGAVPADQVDDLVVAVSEAVTNAMRHGRAPVRVTVWAGGDRIVVAVTDAGPGPQDPYAGLLPSSRDATSGRGLWITHQAVSHVASQRSRDGFTIRLTAGNPY